MHTDSSNVTIVLVEDDLGHTELIKMNLKRSGLKSKLISFDSGLKVIEYFENQVHKEKYIVLLDLNMPGMDGHQILCRLKKNPLTKNVPIIILTTSTSEKEVQRCFDEGCSFFMTKSLDYQKFSSEIHDLGRFLDGVKVPYLKNQDSNED